LVLQAVGGALADTADTNKSSDQGTHIMVGGLGFQVVSLLLFIALAVEFALNVRCDGRAGRFFGEIKDDVGDNGKSESAFKMFLCGKFLACCPSKVKSKLTETNSIVTGDTLHPYAILFPCC
jgi:hypothetical protein